MIAAPAALPPSPARVFHRSRRGAAAGRGRGGLSGRAGAAMLAAVLAVAATGCRSLRNAEADALASQPAAMRVPVGTVHLAQAGSGFVLIRTARYLSLDAGTNLVAVNAHGVETAWLEASEARQGSFLSADIVGGAPSVGEQVLMDYQVRDPTDSGAVGSFGGAGETRQVLE